MYVYYFVSHTLTETIFWRKFKFFSCYLPIIVQKLGKKLPTLLTFYLNVFLTIEWLKNVGYFYQILIG